MFWRVEKFGIRKGQWGRGGLPLWPSSSLRFHCRVLGFDPWSGNQDPAGSPQKNKKKKERANGDLGGAGKGSPAADRPLLPPGGQLGPCRQAVKEIVRK